MSAGDQEQPILPGACSACAHDATGIPIADLAATVIDCARQWEEFLGAVMDHPGGLDDLALRPQPGVWSAVEYGCHVRDALSMVARRIELATLSHEPTLERWEGAAAAKGQGYQAQHPHAVSDDIRRSAKELAALLQPITAGGWQRAGRVDGRSVTVADLARMAIHEARHHLEDARAVVPAPTTA